MRGGQEHGARGPGAYKKNIKNDNWTFRQTPRLHSEVPTCFQIRLIAELSQLHRRWRLHFEGRQKSSPTASRVETCRNARHQHYIVMEMPSIWCVRRTTRSPLQKVSQFTCLSRMVTECLTMWIELSRFKESSNNHLKSCRLPRHLDEEEIYPFRVFKFRIHCLAAKRNAKGEGSLVEFSIGKDM